MALNIPWNLFNRLFNGEITESESGELRSWRDLSELNRNIYDEITEDENLKKIVLSRRWEDSAGEWEKLLTRLKPAERKITITFRKFYLIAGSAAAVFILLIAGSLFLYSSANKHKPEVAEGYTTIISPRGQRTKVILPDQTNVWLNSESTLRYPATYNQKDREVHLEGEGFFEVSRDKQKPFFVQTEELKIKVYGTSFNLKAFPGEKNIEATLIEGKMSVTPFDSSGVAGKEIFLKPKEKLIYQKNAEGLRITKDLLSVADTNKTNTSKILPAKKKTEVKIVLEKDVNTSKDMLWKEGKLIFNNETFGELSVRLERWYDVKIHFQDEEIKKYKFTGEFSKETADQAMEALKISSRHSYEYKMIFRDIYLRRSSNRNIFSN